MHSMSDTRSMAFYKALRVVWDTDVPAIPYEGSERAYVLVGLRFRNTRIIQHVLEVPNVSPFPVDTFSVLQRDVRKVVEGLSPPKSVIGFAHTHPDNYPLPSINDINGIARGMLGLVVSDSHTHHWYVRGRTIEPTIRRSLVE